MGNFKNRLKGYSQIPNELIIDNTLSDRARFLFCYMASKPDDWDFYVQPMCKELKYSADTLRKYMNELIGKGWIERGNQKTNGEGKFGAFDYTLNEFPYAESTVSENYRCGKSPMHNNIYNNTNKEVYKKKENISNSGGELNTCLLTPDSYNPLDKEKEKSSAKKEKTWCDDFEIYMSDLRKAWKELINDKTWITDKERFYPNVDLRLSLEKGCKEFWATEAGWKNKKRKRSTTIDWRATFDNLLSNRSNRVYKPYKNDSKGTITDIGDPAHRHSTI